MKKYQRFIAKLLVATLILSGLLGTGMLAAAADVTFNWVNVNLGNQDVSENIYLTQVFYTSDDINVGFVQGAWTSYLATSTDMINWEVRSHGTGSFVEIDGLFYATIGHTEETRRLLRTNFRDIWEEAAFADHVQGWPTLHIADGAPWIFYSYNGDWERPSGITTTDGVTWVDHHDRPEDLTASWDLSYSIWDDRLIAFDDTHSLRRNSAIEMGERLTAMYISPAEGQAYQPARVYHQGNLVSTALDESAWPTSVTASVSNHAVSINGVNVDFAAYNIEGNNFFRLRDVAYAFNAHANDSFEVNWNQELGAIEVVNWRDYVPVGGEMEPVSTGDVTATLSDANIVEFGSVISMTAYNIADNNFFMLRDLAALLFFDVNWNAETQTIEITR